MSLRASCLLLAGWILISWTFVRADPETPDSSGFAVPAADSVTPLPTLDPITVVFGDGSEHRYARVEPWPNGYLRAFLTDGGVEYIPRAKVRAIRDEKEDVTTRILDRGKSAGQRPFGRTDGPPALRGRPLPLKKGFPLMQAGVLHRMGDGSETAFTADLGGMRNVSPGHSLGITVGVMTDSYTRITLKPRYRKWLGQTFALDLAPGIFVPWDSPEHGSVGFEGELSLSAGDWVSVTGVIEVGKNQSTVPFSQGTSTSSDTDVSWYLGGKAGGELAVFSMFALAVLIAGALTLY